MTDGSADDEEELRRLPRDPERLDTLDLYSHVVAKARTPISDPGRIGDALQIMRERLEAVTRQESTLHGWRVQALFEAIVASLGEVRLLKTEDSGNVFISGPTMKPPDFRIITSTGEQVLVEVKSYFQRDPTASYRTRRAYIDELRRYANAVGTSRLLFAVYWVKWNLWTLTDADLLSETSGGFVEVKLPDAIKANEMGSLGDRTPATEWPLTLTLFSDPAQPREVNDDDEFPFTVGRAELAVAGRLITSSTEQDIAHRLMMATNWPEETDIEIVEGEAIAVRFSFAPEEPPPEPQPFAMHPSLSSLYSTLFNQATVDDAGEIMDLRLDIRPGALADLIPDDYVGEVLKIWRFRQQVS